MKADKKLQKVVEIRKKLIFGPSKLSAVISPLALLELMAWKAEAAFKQYANEAAGVHVIQRKSKKEIGDYLKKLLELRRDEIEKIKVKSPPIGRLLPSNIEFLGQLTLG